MVLSVTTNWILRFLSLSPSPQFFLGCMFLQITFQACQIAVNFNKYWTMLAALAYMNVIIRSSKLDIFAHITFKTSKWETKFSTYFTVDVVTLWTWCWSLLALMNWSFVSSLLNTVWQRYRSCCKPFAPCFYGGVLVV